MGAVAVPCLGGTRCATGAYGQRHIGPASGACGAFVSPELPSAVARAAAKSLFAAFQISQQTLKMVEAARSVISELCGATTRPHRYLDPRLCGAIDLSARTCEARPHWGRSLLRFPCRRAVIDTCSSREPVARSGCTSLGAYQSGHRGLVTGASWTEAAHEAGLTDSAHRTRTRKLMFGIEPTAIRHQSLFRKR